MASFDPSASVPASPSRWHRLSRQVQIQSPIFTAWKSRYRHGNDGREGDFYTFECPDWVQTIALTPAGELILVEQFRFGSEGFGWELSGGVMDAEDGADPIIAAQRELLEETGYASKSARLLGSVYPNPALQGNRTHFVLLEGCTRAAEPQPDANEELHTLVATPDDVEHLLDAGRISHALSLAGLYAYERYRRKLAADSAGGTAAESTKG